MPLDVPPPRTSRFGSPPGAQPRALGAAGAGPRGQVPDLDRRRFASAGRIPATPKNWCSNTAAQAGKRVRVGFGQDPGQAGKSQAFHLVRALTGFSQPQNSAGFNGPVEIQVLCDCVVIR